MAANSTRATNKTTTAATAVQSAPEKRDFRLYPGQTTLFQNLSTNDFDQLFVLPTTFSLQPASFRLVFETWLSGAQFNDRADPNAFFRKAMPAPTADFVQIKQQFADVFAAIEQRAFEFLSVAAKDYKLQSVEVNLAELKINVQARHKSRQQFVNRFVETSAEFETVKAENPQFVEALVGFAWAFGKQHDAFLRSLKPLE